MTTPVSSNQVQALLNSLERQRNVALNGQAQAEAALEVANQRIADLQEQVKKLLPEADKGPDA